MPHLAARVFGTPLAIEPGKLSVILGAIGDRVIGDAVELESVKALLPASGAKPHKDSITQVVDGVAMIDVRGTLVHRSSWMDAASGLQSYEGLSSEFDRAIADPNIRGVLLCIDSPGGEVSGCFEMAERIHAARGTKPIYAIASDTACSAAYLIGSACDKFYATEAAVTGSIGVVVAHLDVSEADKKAGVKVTHIHAGARKVDGNPHEPLSGEAKDTLQALVDKTYAVFISRVAAYRGLSPSDVMATEAAVFVGADAVKARIIDGIKSTRAVLAEIKSGQKALPFVVRQGLAAAAAQASVAAAFAALASVVSRAESDMPPPEHKECECEGEPGCDCDEANNNDKEAAMGDPTKDAAAALAARVKELESENVSLKADLAEARTRVAVAVEAQRHAIIEKHVRAGRITPATVADVEEFGKAMEPTELDARLSKWPVLTHPVPSGRVDALPPAGISSDALKALEAKAAELRIAHPSLSGPDAFVKACEQNPTLYAEHRKQHRAANTRR